MVVKTRHKKIGQFQSVFLSNGVYVTNENVNLVPAFQRVMTHNNPYRRTQKTKFSGGGSWDNGNEFENNSISCSLKDWSPSTVVLKNKAGEVMYNVRTLLAPSQKMAGTLQGTNVNADPSRSVLLQEQFVLNSTPTRLSRTSLDAKGATAVSRCIPTNPVVDLSTTVAELVSAKKFFSLPGKSGSASGEYLNLQLGILPVVSDIQDTWKAAKESEEILKQYERDSGKFIRRRYQFPDVTTVTSSEATNVPISTVGANLNTYLAGKGTQTTTTTITERTWFSGAFTYYLPKNGWRKKFSEYERLYGVRPGTETAWNVIPLSFVADYFANIGDVLHNLDAFNSDGLVMPYGYVMHEQTARYDYTWKGLVNNEHGVPTMRYLAGTVTYKSQQRRRANPFGFGIAQGDLSLRQLSILAALGVNRK